MTQTMPQGGMPQGMPQGNIPQGMPQGNIPQAAWQPPAAAWGKPIQDTSAGTLFPKLPDGTDLKSWGNAPIGFIQGFVPIKVVQMHGTNGAFTRIAGFGFNYYCASEDDIVNSIEWGSVDTPTTVASAWDEGNINPLDVVGVVKIASKGDPKPDGGRYSYHHVSVGMGDWGEHTQQVKEIVLREVNAKMKALGMTVPPKVYAGDRTGIPMTQIGGTQAPMGNAPAQPAQAPMGNAPAQAPADNAPAQPAQAPMGNAPAQPAQAPMGNAQAPAQAPSRGFPTFGGGFPQ